MEAPTIELVRDVITTSKSDAFVGSMIEEAALIAGTCQAVVDAPAPKQSAIVRWIACHLISLNNSGTLSQQSIGDASESYVAAQAAFGKGLSSTSYGQRAILLEPELSKVGRPSPVFVVL